MVVQHNISAMTANRYYGINNSTLGKSMEKLSSGYAINRAGDNAAGLAVSEKMRAQIAGLTQASKNAQDGISMVQTFEGALQETDSILQRMRTLAVQSANGSYQDDVDRDAMQLEFDQLNDELNQIADTDFNGVVVLNGGQMADGVRANEAGKIDYATKKADVTALAQEGLEKKVQDAAAVLTKAKNAYTSGNYDLSSNGLASEWNTIDSSKYTQNNANQLWVDLGFSKTDTSSKKTADPSKADQIDITFEFDGTNWTAKSGVAKLDGEVVKNIESDKLTSSFDVKTLSGDSGTNLTQVAKDHGDGGFTVALKNTTVTDYADDSKGATTQTGLGNVIFDATGAKKGDTVTVSYTNGAPSKLAPNNIGWALGTLDVDSSGKTALTEPTLSLVTGATGVNDDTMTDELRGAFEALNGTSFEIEYNKILADPAQADDGVNIKIGGKAITFDASGNSAKQQNVSGTPATPAATFTLKDSEGNTHTYGIGGNQDYASTEFTIYSLDKDGKVDKALMKISGLQAATKYAESGTPAAATAGTEGTIKGTISIDTPVFSGATTFGIKAGDDPNLESSGKAYDTMKNAEKALQKASDDLAAFKKLDSSKEADWTKIKETFASTQSSSGSVVSVSDDFDQSKAKMTYTDKMSLQVGARTKDMVNFKFSYSSDDLGGLEKNMNCSARKGGLETAGLSLKTQSEANDAIDKIDKALNKVSMVRATFGAVQNRLEHKINNLDTNTENITAAESRIRDTQMDQEMMKFTSAQILSQASQSMLAQANSLPQGVLQLLG